MSAYLINPSGGSWVPLDTSGGYSTDFANITFENYFLNIGNGFFEIVGLSEGTPDPFSPGKTNYTLRIDNTLNRFGVPPIQNGVGLFTMWGGVSQITFDNFKVQFDTPFGLPGSIFVQLFFNVAPVTPVKFSMHLFFSTT